MASKMTSKTYKTHKAYEEPGQTDAAALKEINRVQAERIATLKVMHETSVRTMQETIYHLHEVIRNQQRTIRSQEEGMAFVVEQHRLLLEGVQTVLCNHRAPYCLGPCQKKSPIYCHEQLNL